ncbi:hypothetical protein GCM10010156_34000 [Planobispora rosea]|uniref:Uncharacterized protein n=1 Tax=Planobispora rosea TaxID=35762 RepID=A0A8J3WCT4_PLARO|nr:hypothetical protein [Planobispora rosea]GGS72327.1 hypothetical protein GCM10010156_34000 [Planobispora rosea]GIH85264.1 hypothetical protein Pro02_36720 [Planobispora rosea]
MGPFSVVRWARAASFAATCAALATLGHLAGGGSFDRAAALGGFLLLLLPALALTGRERTLASILPATAASQIVLHTLLTQSADRQAAAHRAEMAAMEGMGGMDHVHPAASTGSGMVLVHAASVLLTSVWLRWLETGLCALARQLAGWVLRPLLFLLVAGRPSAPVRLVSRMWRDETARVRLFLRHVLVLRGPPGGRTRPAAAV